MFYQNIHIIKNSTKAIIVGAISDQNFSLVLSFTFIAVAILGFLSHNSFPARILMGDSGSYLIGFNFAALSILGFTSNISFPSNANSAFNLIIPGLILPFLFSFKLNKLLIKII